MGLKRSVYADKDELINRLEVERRDALSVIEMPSLPRYRKNYWQGKADGLAYAIAMLKSWQGEREPGETG